MTVELSNVADDSTNIVNDLEDKVKILMDSVNRFKV